MKNFIQRWFRKASRALPLEIRLAARGGSIFTPRNFDDLAREGYEQAVWVYACVREILTAVKDAPIELLQRSPGGSLVKLSDHPLLDLLNRPNEHSWDFFTEEALGYFLLAGNTYIEAVGPRTGLPRELYPKRPDRVTVTVSGSKRFVTGFEYRVGLEEPVPFSRSQMLQVRSFHPRNDFYGMSALEAAAQGVDAHNIGLKHNVALLKNGARPSGVFTVEGNLDDVQFNRAKTQLQETASVGRRGEVILLEGGARWAEMGVPPKDLDWLGGLSEAGRMIHAAFGVHPVLTGLQTSTFENQRMALRGLYTRTVLPVYEHFLSELMLWLAPRVPNGDSLILRVARDGIAALTEDQDKLYERNINAFLGNVITRNEARLSLGYEELPDGGVFAHELGADAVVEDDGLEGEVELAVASFLFKELQERGSGDLAALTALLYKLRLSEAQLTVFAEAIEAELGAARVLRDMGEPVETVVVERAQKALQAMN